MNDSRISRTTPNTISLELRALNVKQRVSLFHSLEFIGVHLLHGHETQQILCPFHDDSKPSARAYADSGKLFCFTCHKTWDSVTLVAQKHNLSYPDAIELLEKQFSIQSPLENVRLAVKFNIERAQSTEPKVSFLTRFVEERLISARKELGLHQYVKLLTALDLINFQHKRKLIDTEIYTVLLKRILEKIPPSV